MDLGLKDKGVLVLASSGGIGKGVALELAREGAQVTLFSRSEERLARAADEIEAETGHRPFAVVGDLSRAGEVERAVETTVERCGGIWALFNNTGGPPAGGFESFDDAAWHAAFELTVLGYVRAIRAALPHMKAAGGGRIVNNSSVSTRQAIDGLLLSNVFRAGLVGLGKSLARELAPYGVLVNTVGPGRIDTDRIAQLDALWAEKAGSTVEAQRAKSEAAIPLGRYGTAEDFGRAAAFLCSAANTYVTGQVILIDGGMTESY